MNIKFYAQNKGLLDVPVQDAPDYILVLTGPHAPAGSSRGMSHPLVIESVYLFDAARLLAALRAGGVKIGIATSVRQSLWRQAEIYPARRPDVLALTADQRAALAQFGGRGAG